MKEYLQATVAIIIAISTIYFICWVRREKFTFLNLSLNAKIINQIGDLLLVSIVVLLKNMGKTRISARTRKDIIDKHSGFLYGKYDEWDKCKHAGTLKIRKVPDSLNVDLFDWYSLPAITNIQSLKDGNQYESDFEQINYLEEYEDHITQYQDVYFWIEPKEAYHQEIMVYLKPGIYVLKAVFLVKETEPPNEEEYWSCKKVVNIG
jgi:hypothetical protein